MTEAEWLACEDPTPMLEFLPGKASDRKMRLLACACCRPHAEAVGGHEADVAVTLAELQADGSPVTQELQIALCNLMRYPSPEVVGGAYQRYSGFVVALDLQHSTLESALACFAEAAGRDTQSGAAIQRDELSAPQPHKSEAAECERRAQTSLLRDIFGNPFRPVAFDPAWRTSDVTALATSIYAEKAFDRMPILADALQEAGCDSDELLNHLRSAGPHVKGCWALDLVLGKE